jgi:hypothetical protein
LIRGNHLDHGWRPGHRERHDGGNTEPSEHPPVHFSEEGGDAFLTRPTLPIAWRSSARATPAWPSTGSRPESVQQGAAVQLTIPDVGVFQIPIVRRPGRPLPQGQLRTHAVCCGECPRHLTVLRRAAMSSHPAPPPVVGAADGSPARPPSCCGRSTGRTCGHAAAWDELVADRAEQAGLRVADVSRSSLAKLVRLYRLGAKVRAGLRQARRRRRSPRAGRTV